MLHVSYYAQNFAGISGGFSHGSKGFMEMEHPFCRQLKDQPGLWHCVFSRNISDLILKRINGEANNFKMELFNDIHEGSGGC